MIFMLLGASCESSFDILSEMPGNIVEPPERTTLPYRSFRMSTYESIKGYMLTPRRNLRSKKS